MFHQLGLFMLVIFSFFIFSAQQEKSHRRMFSEPPRKDDEKLKNYDTLKNMCDSRAFIKTILKIRRKGQRTERLMRSVGGSLIITCSFVNIISFLLY